MARINFHCCLGVKDILDQVCQLEDIYINFLNSMLISVFYTQMTWTLTNSQLPSTHIHINSYMIHNSDT